MPSRMISPLWIGSSALTHLISVDLPEPDGPHTTTTSPLATLVVQSFSAWKLGPYHLSTWLISIMMVSRFGAARKVRSLSHPTRVYPSWAFYADEVGYIRLRWERV